MAVGRNLGTREFAGRFRMGRQRAGHAQILPGLRPAKKAAQRTAHSCVRAGACAYASPRVFPLRATCAHVFMCSYVRRWPFFLFPALPANEVAGGSSMTLRGRREARLGSQKGKSLACPLSLFSVSPVCWPVPSGPLRCGTALRRCRAQGRGPLRKPPDLTSPPQVHPL